jgi:hypothetical protein
MISDVLSDAADEIEKHLDSDWYDESDWSEIWRVLGEMKSLQRRLDKGRERPASARHLNGKRTVRDNYNIIDDDIPF